MKGLRITYVSQLHPGYHKVELILNKLVQEIHKLAHLDGIASTNEKLLIHNLKLFLPSFKKNIKPFFDDGELTLQEKSNIHKLLSDFLADTVQLANSDEKIEYDEKVLLEKLKQQFIQLMQEINKL